MIKNLFKNIPVTKIFGTAGAGKTTKLIDIIDNLFKSGVRPENIAFASFTNKAVDEMVERILKKFPHFNKDQFCHFKTIHAMAYASSDIKKIIKQKELAEIARSIGLEISYNINPEDCGGAKKGDQIITVESLSRLRMVSLKEQWAECRFDDLPFYMVENWKNKVDEYKDKHKLIDFTDLLQNYNGNYLEVDYIFIDEAQDLCPLQWNVLDKMAANCKQVYIAGDDDQLIYKWAGASVDYILNIKCEEEVILAKSYRLPSNVYKLTRKILSKIKNRKPKECEPTKKNGKIIYVSNFDNIIFEENEEYLVLIRNKFQSREISEKLELDGLPYFNMGKSSIDCGEIKAIIIWEKFRKTKIIDYRDYEKCKKFSGILEKYDRERVPVNLFEQPWYNVLNRITPRRSSYFRVLLSKGYKFSQEPKIKISTIHQAKGGECDNVIVLTDVSVNTWKNIHSDDEHRVWYVAISRAKENLIIVREQGDQFYKI